MTDKDSPRWQGSFTTLAEREFALRHYDLLDDSPFAGGGRPFDDIASMAAEVCEASLAGVGFFTENRQVVAGVAGWAIAAGHPPEKFEPTLCHRAMANGDLLVLPDLMREVAAGRGGEAPVQAGLGFYAGAVLRTPEGLPIGTVCVLDVAPRPNGLTKTQERMLRCLADQVMMALELRRALRRQTELTQSSRQSGLRLKVATEVAGFGIGEADYRSDTAILDERCAELFDLPANIPLPRRLVHERFHPEDTAALTDLLTRSLDPGRPRVIEAPMRVTHRDGRVLHLRIRNQVEFAPDGGAGMQPVSSIFAVMDHTAQTRLEERQSLLIEELDHRVANLFEIAASLMHLSARDAADVKSVAADFTGRLHALSRSHQLIRQNRVAPGGPGRVDLEGLVNVVLQPYRHDRDVRLVVEGPNVEVSRAAATNLALALHELATNAAKYGALSAGGGGVRVSWSIGDGRLRLVWLEAGAGDAPGLPSRTGFGSRLLTLSVEEQLKGKFQREWLEDGLEAVLDLPLLTVLATPN
jgi:two-component sensor histidine kinase